MRYMMQGKVTLVYEPRKALVPHRHSQRLLLFVGCLTSQQHARVLQRRVCSDNYTCSHTEIEVADETVSPSHSILPLGIPVPARTPCEGSHWNTVFDVTGMTRLGKKDPGQKREWNPGPPLSIRTPCHQATKAVSTRERHGRPP